MNTIFIFSYESKAFSQRKSYFTEKISLFYKNNHSIEVLPLHYIISEKNQIFMPNLIKKMISNSQKISQKSRQNAYSMIGHFERQVAMSKNMDSMKTYPTNLLQIETKHNSYINGWRNISHLFSEIQSSEIKDEQLNHRLELIAMLATLYLREPSSFNKIKIKSQKNKSSKDSAMLILAMTVELTWIMGGYQKAYSYVANYHSSNQDVLSRWLQYRRGFLEYKIGEHSKSFQTFIHLLTSGLNHDLKYDPIQKAVHKSILSLSYKNETNAELSLNLKMPNDPNTEQKVLMGTSIFFLRRKKTSYASTGLLRLIKEHPDSVAAPLANALILDLYTSLNKVEKAKLAAERAYTYTDKITNLQPKNNNLFPSSESYTNHLEPLAFYYIHSLVKLNKQYIPTQPEMQTYKHLIDMTQRFLNQFPNNSQREKIWFYQGQFFGYLGDVIASSNAYKRTAVRLNAIRRIRNLSNSEKKLMYSSLTRMVTSILNPAKVSILSDLDSEKNTTVEEQLVTTCEKYENIALKYDQIIADCYQLLSIKLANEEQIEKSEFYLWKIVANFPEQPYTDTAIKKLIYSYRKNKKEQIQVADKILKLASLNRPKSHEKLKDKIEKFKLYLAHKNPFQIERAHQLFNIALQNIEAPNASVTLRKAFKIFNQLNLTAETDKVVKILLHNFPNDPLVQNLLYQYANQEIQRFKYKNSIEVFKIFRKYVPNYKFMNEIAEKECRAAIFAKHVEMHHLCTRSFKEAASLSRKNWNMLSKRYYQTKQIKYLQKLNFEGWPKNIPLTPGDKILHLSRMYNLTSPNSQASQAYGTQAVEIYVSYLSEHSNNETLTFTQRRAISQIKYISLNNPLKAFKNTTIQGDNLDEYFASFEEFNSKLGELVKLYQEVLNIGDPHWGSLVLFDLHKAFNHAAAEIEKNPKIEMKDFGTLQKSLQKAGDIVKKRAASALKECVKTIEKNSVYHPLTRKILNFYYKKVDPKKQIKEFTSPPEYLSIIAPDFLEESYAM